MNLRPVIDKPVIYLVSTSQQAIELVNRIAGVLNCDALIVPEFTNLQNHIRLESPGCIVVPLREQAIDLDTVLTFLPSIGMSMPVIVATGEVPVEIVVRIMELGAYKVLYKTFTPEMLRTSIEQAISLDVKRLEMKQMYLETERSLESLTSRQLVVLKDILNGKPTKLIALELKLSQRMIEKERSEILEAFKVKSTAEVTFRVGEYRILRRMRNRIDVPHEGFLRMHNTANKKHNAFEDFLERFGEL